MQLQVIRNRASLIGLRHIQIDAANICRPLVYGKLCTQDLPLDLACSNRHRYCRSRGAFLRQSMNRNYSQRQVRSLDDRILQVATSSITSAGVIYAKLKRSRLRRQ
jgi:hypothetical protein